MLYRSRRATTVMVEALGRTVDLSPVQSLDSENPDDAAIIAEWAHRGLLRADSQVEQATAEPGEARTTRRGALA
jgi:hypothetical protein